MRKLFAWALTALMMLSACAGCAELADAFPAVTVTGELTVDGDRAREALESLQLPADQIARWEGFLGLLSGSRDALVIADEGIEYRNTQSNGTEMFIAGETRDGRVAVASSLFPGILLTQAASEIAWEQIAAASDAVVDEVDRLLEAVAAAVKPQRPEFGAYEIDGETFDLRMPLDIDVEAMMEAGAAMERGLRANAVLRSAGLDALPGYAGRQIDPSALPTVTAARYDADGRSATVYTAELAFAGSQAVNVSVRVDGDDVRARLDVPALGLEVTVDYASTKLSVEALYGGNDILLTVEVQPGKTTTMTTSLYVNDPAYPVATEVNTFTLMGARTIAIEAGGKTELDIDDVITNNGGAGARLLADMMVSGLPGLSGNVDNK